MKKFMNIVWDYHMNILTNYAQYTTKKLEKPAEAVA